MAGFLLSVFQSKDSPGYSGYQIWAMTEHFALQLAAILLLVVSSMSFSEEVTQGTMQFLVTNAGNRKGIILGKFIALSILAILIVVLITLAGGLFGALLGDLTALYEGDYLFYTSGQLFRGFLIASGLTVFPFLSLVTFGLCVSTFAYSTGTAIGTSLLLYFLLQFISQIDKIGRYFFSNFLFAPIKNVSDATEGLYINWFNQVYWLLGSSLITILVLILYSLYIFDRRDLWE